MKLWQLNKQVDGDKKKINKEKIPNHIAIIMDGNGRWAKERNLQRTMGHRAGVETLRKIVKECSNLGIKYLSVYAFSTENWIRPKEEVSALMDLLVEFLGKELDELHEGNVIINYLGDISKLPEKCQDILRKSKNKTKNNSGLNLNLCLNYGGRDEIIKSFKEIYNEIKNGDISIDDVDEKMISRHLYTSGMPDPDMLIRPSGELRISNFLIWQCAYTEFWFSDIYWPDFRIEHLHRAIIDFQKRDRRFGCIK